MKLLTLPMEFTICQVEDFSKWDAAQPYFFAAHTKTECSLVCPSDRIPANALIREPGWRAFFVEGTLDFSLVGILSRISGILAAEGISLFAVSTYDTDYIFVKSGAFSIAQTLLERNGCLFEEAAP